MSKSFKDLMAKDESTVMIVDSLNLAFRYKHQKKREFAEDYLRTVQSLANSYNASTVYITADMGSSTYRKKLLPEYKQNRKDKYALQTEAEAEEFANFIEDFEKTLVLLSENYPIFRYKGVEADDIAAYLVSELKDKTIWMISSDKDWDLLVNENVNRFSYVTRKEITKENWSEHYEVERREYISFKCLTGDAGDNIFGVPGIGPKRAAGLIEQYGTLFDIIGNLPLDSKYKYIQSLNEFGSDNLMRNFELMDLHNFHEEAIGIDNQRDIRSILESN